MSIKNLNQVPDEQIPTTLAPNPILEAKAEARLTKTEEIYLPSAPLPVVRQAQEAAGGAGVVLLLLAGLLVKLTGASAVKLNPSLRDAAGLSEGQVRRAAKELDAVGLIRIHSAQGQRREITLTDVEFLAWLRKAKT